MPLGPESVVYADYVERETIDAVLSICHLIMPQQQIYNKAAVINNVDLLRFTTTWVSVTFWSTYIEVQQLERLLNAG